ncbi:MAG TPA: hypothetical protein VN181_07885 [Thermoanaerobaculia bacterium]|nr:hypothetical protein [Thermoanaerobaculia bacterium]
MALPAFLLAAIAAAAPFDDIPQLEPFFDRPVNAVRSVDGMVAFTPPSENLIVARVADDGRIVTGCFASEEAAQRFLDRDHRVAATKSQDK